MSSSLASLRQVPRSQRGVATLVTTLVILFILTLIVLSSSNVALFEQKTATNENRQRLADQAAEYALRLGGEFMKANIVNLASAETNGWLAAGTSKWALCANVSSMSDTHPCKSEPNPARRNQLYFYCTANCTNTNSTSINVPFNVVTGAGVTQIGGTAAFPVQSTVNALLCRLDTTNIDAGDEDGDGNVTEILPSCRATPDPKSANRIAITLVANSRLTGEGAVGSVKETWANFDTFSTAAAVPLVASGTVDITGNVTIVTAPNGAGQGVPASIWTPVDADVDCTSVAANLPGGSCASVSSCQLGEFLQDTPEANLKTVCPFTNNACGCDSPSAGGTPTPEEVFANNPDMLSGKVSGANPKCCENMDILDRDGNRGKTPNGNAKDITFYPGAGIDDFNAQNDDSLFEWIFNVSNESNTTRPAAGSTACDPVGACVTGNTLTNCSPVANCAKNALLDASILNANSVTCDQLIALGAAASGLYYVNDYATHGQCSLPDQVGSPTSSAIVVVDQEATINNTKFFGLLFVRSDAKNAELHFTGNADIYGALVVEGTATGHGNVNIVYLDTSTSTTGKKLPEGTRLGRVSGSWLDGARGGF
jgi:Tfp pilus assembly protein PilX